MLWKFVQHSFAGGILDRALQGRQDLDRYFSSCSKIKNFFVRKQGDIVKRRGTDEVCDLTKFLGLDKDGRQIEMKKARLIPVTRTGESGRYLFLTGGFCGVASKDGVMTTDATYTREIDEYYSQDQYGNDINYAGTDVMHDMDNPYELIHPTSSGIESTVYSTFQSAVDAAVNGDTVRLHSNIVINQNQWWDGSPSGIIINGKDITIDYYGYDVVTRCSGYTYRFVNGPHVRVTNSRGYRSNFYLCANGGNPWFYGVNEYSEGTEWKTPSLVLEGNVYYHYSGNTGGGIVACGRYCKVTINSGRFVADYTSWKMFTGGDGTEMTVNGGYFEQLTYGGGSCVIFKSASKLVINGGYFKTPCEKFGNDGYGNYWNLIQSDSGVTEINGGCFVGPAGVPLVCGYKAYQTASPSHLVVRRGYFTCDKVNWGRDANYTLNEFKDSVSEFNSEYPDEDGMYGVKVSTDLIDYVYSENDAVLNIPFRMKIPYADSILDEIDYKQSGDTVFLTHRDYPPMKVVFDNNGYASISTVKFDSDGVYPPVLSSTEIQNNSHTTTTSTTTCDNEGKITSTQTSTSSTHGANKTIKYCVTYVKDGVESKPSNEVSVTYEAPWMQTATVPLSWNKGDNALEPDYYNIYKDNGGGFGLIGTSWLGDKVLGRSVGVPSNSGVYLADSTSSSMMAMLDYQKTYGLTAKDLYKRLSANRSGEITPRASGDTTFIVPRNNASTRTVTFTYPEDAKVSGNAIAVDLDGRFYDPVLDRSYIVISAHRVSGTVVLKKSDGTTVTKTLASKYFDGATSTAGGLWPLQQAGVWADWWTLQRKSVACGSGANVDMWYVGAGLQTEYFAEHNRRITWDGFNADGYSIVSITLTFDNSIYSDWGGVQAVIHGFKVMKSLGGTNTFEDNYITPKMETTPPRTDVETHFIAGGDYPACVDFYQQRMVVASSWNDPFKFWMSMVGDLYNFVPHETMQENDPIEAETAAKILPNINRILVTRDMLLFTDGGEYKVAPISGNTLSYKTVSAKLQSEIGIANWLKPVCVKDEIVFADRTGRTVYATKYNYSTDGYDSKELSVMSQDIFRDNMIVDMAYRRHPESMIECVLADGTIADMVYLDEQGVTAWVKQELGGGFSAKAIACPETTNRDASTETMLMVMKGGKFRLWMARANTDDSSIGKILCMDGVRDVAGAKLTSIANDGWIAVGTDGTVLTSAGVASNPSSVSGTMLYRVGYVFDAEIVTVRPEAQGERSSMQFEIKGATEVEVRTLSSGPFSVKAHGLSDDHLRTFDLPTTFSGGNVITEDADCKKTLVGRNSRDGRVCLRSSTPFPLNICYLAVTYQIEPENGASK